MTKLPEAFEERMKRLLGDEYPRFRESYETVRSYGLRRNRLKPVPDSALLRAVPCPGEIPWAPDGVLYREEDRPGKHVLHEAGAYYIQEPSAMAAGTLLDPRPGERVLDLCAAPGGKTTDVAARMGGNGFLVSNEIHPARAVLLSRNVERMGIENCAVFNETPERLLTAFPSYFDRVLVDAPCSGEGMMRKDETAADEWSEENVALCAARQRKILSCAADMLKPGGLMVYSTCTFAPEEDEGTIGWFLREHPGFSISEVFAFPGFSSGRPEWGDGNPELSRTIRIWPHLAPGEGHFLAALRKEGTYLPGATGEDGDPGSDRKRKKHGLFPKDAFSGDPAKREQFLDFCRETFAEPDRWTKGRFLLYGDTLFRLPEGMPDPAGLKCLRPGLELGTFMKNRFEPAHALAMALHPGEVKRVLDIPAGDRRASGYLLGETVLLSGAGEPNPESGRKGWILVCVSGISLGWGKQNGGVVKNHYPKGLRRETVY